MYKLSFHVNFNTIYIKQHPCLILYFCIYIVFVTPPFVLKIFWWPPQTPSQIFGDPSKSLPVLIWFFLIDDYRESYFNVPQ